MKTIIRRELKNYLKNPILWVGMLAVIFGIYQHRCCVVCIAVNGCASCHNEEKRMIK